MSNDLTEYKNVIEIEYKTDNDKVLLYQHGGELKYISADIVKLKPEIVEIEEIIVRKQYSKVRFKNPISCYLNEGRYETYLECGINNNYKNESSNQKHTLSKDNTQVICSKDDEEIDEKKLLEENENRKISYC